MDPSSLYKGNFIFRNQPPHTFFNQSFTETKDVLFLQIDEIHPIFLTDAQLNNNAGFSQAMVVDPRTKTEQINIKYDYSVGGKKQKCFRCRDIKSLLTKEEHEIGLRVLLAQQERKKIEENDFNLWLGLQAKLRKERLQMQDHIREFEETYKEDVYKPRIRLDKLYKDWFSKIRDSYAKLYPGNLSFNTHTGLPIVKLCKTINEDPIEIAGVQLLSRHGYVRLYENDHEIDWQNLNFRLDYFSKCYNESQELLIEAEQINAELESIDNECTGQRFYIPLKTLLFILTAGEIDLPTEVLLEIRNSNNAMDGKIVSFGDPLPAHNCGYHTHQQVLDHSFAAFISAKGRAKWLKVENDELHPDNSNINEMNVGGVDLTQYAPMEFDEYLRKNETFYKNRDSVGVKENIALLKWFLKPPDSECGLKILTTLKLPAAVNENGDKFLPFEFIKLESKPKYGCELFTKYELLKAWLQMRLMNFTTTTDYGICYRLSAYDLTLQMTQKLTLQQIEQSLMDQYRINPNQLMANLTEFLKMLNNMVAGKYMLRYNPIFSDKLMLCAPSQEITQNTVFLHSLLAAEPTKLAWMLQQYYLPISDTLCSAVHLDHQILPCTFQPQLPGQRNLKTFEAERKKRTSFLENIANKNQKSIEEKQLYAHKKAKRHKRLKKKAKNLKKAKKATNDKSDEEIMVEF